MLKKKKRSSWYVYLEHRLITTSEGRCLGSNLSFSTFAVEFGTSYFNFFQL